MTPLINLQHEKQKKGIKEKKRPQFNLNLKHFTFTVKNLI